MSTCHLELILKVTILLYIVKMCLCDSDAVRRLAALAYDTLREALAGSRECAVHLGHSVHRMFDLYCEVVPSHHGEKLSTLPLLAGG